MQLLCGAFFTVRVHVLVRGVFALGVLRVGSRRFGAGRTHPCFANTCINYRVAEHYFAALLRRHSTTRTLLAAALVMAVVVPTAALGNGRGADPHNVWCLIDHLRIMDGARHLSPPWPRRVPGLPASDHAAASWQEKIRAANWKRVRKWQAEP